MITTVETSSSIQCIILKTKKDFKMLITFFMRCIIYLEKCVKYTCRIDLKDKHFDKRRS